MKSIGIFCGSSLGGDIEFIETAEKLGKVLSKRYTRIIYGGVGSGLMDVVAQSFIKEGGEIIGVTTEQIAKSYPAPNVPVRLLFTDNLSVRKNTIIDMSDGVLALPGGLGTFDEIFDILVLKQTKMTQKPFGILNVNDFFNPLLLLLKHLKEMSFLTELDNERLFVIDSCIYSLLTKMESKNIMFFEKK